LQIIIKGKKKEETLLKLSDRKLPCYLLLMARTPALFANSLSQTPRMSSNFSPSVAGLSNSQPIE